MYYHLKFSIPIVGVCHVVYKLINACLLGIVIVIVIVSCVLCPAKLSVSVFGLQVCLLAYMIRR